MEHGYSVLLVTELLEGRLRMIERYPSDLVFGWDTACYVFFLFFLAKLLLSTLVFLDLVVSLVVDLKK